MSCAVTETIGSKLFLSIAKKSQKDGRAIILYRARASFGLIICLGVYNFSFSCTVCTRATPVKGTLCAYRPAGVQWKAVIWPVIGLKILKHPG
jgi:hypothetical protein